ncbi:MAG: twin-arginine translocase subunit TatC [Proteobacteria bacterium]|nr:twin-arginine translocase subunit TatC [Pseudomonadota bacterium]
MTKQPRTDEKQPFLSHLKELRDRLIVSFIALAIAFVFAYYFKEKVFSFLMQPFVKVMPEKSSFIFTYVTEAFITYFKISFVVAIFISSPVILYQFWMFVAPGLYEKEKKYVLPFIFFGSLCFVSGALFSYYIIMPVIYKFFVSYAGNFIIPMPDLKGYMNLTLKLLIIFGLIFELPLVAFYLGKAGIINHRMLSTKRRYAILAIFILSAIITPPDVSSQILMALPMWGLYELSIIITRFFGKKVPIDETA